MGAGSLSNGQLVHGQISIRNKYCGQDKDSRFVRLVNQDTGLEFRCRVGFEDTTFGVDFNGVENSLSQIFGLSKGNLDLQFPVIASFYKNYAFLLEPPHAECIFPGAATSNLSYVRRLRDNIFLRQSRIFYDDTRVNIGNGHYPMKNKYDLAVHHNGISPFDDEECTALVFRVERHVAGGSPQYYKHVNGLLLGYCGELGVLDEHLAALTFCRDRAVDGSVWWDHYSELPAGFFENLTRTVALFTDEKPERPKERRYMRRIGPHPLSKRFDKDTAAVPEPSNPVNRSRRVLTLFR